MTKFLFKKILLWEILLVSIVVFLLHKLALVLFLYWSVWWFDILMHFLGGLVIGLMALFFFFVSGYFKPTMDIKNKSLIVVITVASVLVVGLSWELWELFVGFTDRLLDQFDTLLDLFMDFLGSIFATLYYFKKTKNESES